MSENVSFSHDSKILHLERQDDLEEKEIETYKDLK